MGGKRIRLPRRFEDGSCTRVEDTPGKQNGAGLEVANDEDKGMVNGDLRDRLRAFHRNLDHRSGSRRFRATFVHRHKGLVFYSPDEEVAPASLA